ncbi:unnamed protein product [Rhizophagus irregularis]|nr:unnamed protein product [Rhizophagus irregularis]
MDKERNILKHLKKDLTFLNLLLTIVNGFSNVTIVKHGNYNNETKNFTDGVHFCLVTLKNYIYINGPHSVYAQSNYQTQLSSGQRPYSVVGYEGYEGLSSLQQPSSFRVIRRRHQRKNVRNNSNVLNPTLDNFYNTLRRAGADLNVTSAKSWVKEYEGYRRQVLSAEKSSIENTRPCM